MNQVLFLAAQDNSGDLPLPVMTVIAMLLLLLPYLISRYTGKSLTEWLRLSVLFERIDSGMDVIREKLFGKKRIYDKSGNDSQKKENPGSKAAAGKEKNKSAARRKSNVKNDFLHFISEVLNFARKNRLFAIVPGNIRSGDRRSELTAVLVTKSRVIGIMGYGFDGDILCRKDDRAWQSTLDGKTAQIGSLGRETKEQEEILCDVMKKCGLDTACCETVMVFTSGGAVLKGDRPANAFTKDAFFRSLQNGRDLREGPLDPKETGLKLNHFRK